MPNSLMNSALTATSAAGATPVAGNSPVPSPATQPGAPPGGAPGGRQYTVPEVKDAIHKQALIDGKMRALLKGGKPVSKKDVIQMGVSLVAQRALSAEEMAGYFGSLPDEPMQVRDWLQNHATRVESNLQQLLTMIAGQEAPPPDQITAPPMPSGDNGGNVAQ